MVNWVLASASIGRFGRSSRNEEDRMSEQSDRLRRIAPKLNALRPDPNARVNYELMSGGLVWSDELPPWEELQDVEPHCLRGIWRYRSTLILGAAEERFR